MTANIVQVSADHPDVNRLAALFDDYRTHYGQPPGLAAVRTWLLEQLTQGRLTVTAAVEADQMLGFISTTVLPASLRLGTALSIRDLFVAPQHRRRGIAGSLLQHAIVNAREDGAQRVSLQTEAGNMPALTLYRAAGFRSVEGLEVLNLHLADSEH